MTRLSPQHDSPEASLSREPNSPRRERETLPTLIRGDRGGAPDPVGPKFFPRMKDMRVQPANFSSRARAAAAVFAVVVCLAVLTPFAPRAQKAKESGVNVTGVSTRADARGAVITVTGDGALSRAQTWQDDEGFHIVGYRWSMAAGAARGVKVRRVGESLELVIPVKRGGSVSVHPRFNSLDLVVGGGLQQPPDARDDAAARPRDADRDARQRGAHPGAQALAQTRAAAAERVKAIERRTAQPQAAGQDNSGGEAESKTAGKPDARAKTEQQAKTQEQPAETYVAGQFQEAAPPPPQQQEMPTSEVVIAAAAATPEPVRGEAALTRQTGMEVGTQSGGSSVLTIALVSFLVAVGGTLVFVRQRGRGEAETADGAKPSDSKALVKTSSAKAAGAKAAEAASNANAKGAAKDGATKDGATKDGGGQALVRHEAGAPAAGFSMSAPPVLFGAFRIEQEVEKMVRGEAHSVEVLGSRAQDDRRALEARLLRMVAAEQATEGERARVRAALEDYGFVARQSAALLLAPDTFQRSSAARMLGKIASASSLPFLLEALYDADPVVRTEAVVSLGALGLPSAIGALLDMARRHPEVPAQLLGSALSACSVDSIELTRGEGGDYSLAGEDLFTGEINAFEPVAEIEQLPVWLEDETLAEALDRLDSTDVEARVASAQQLAQYSVQRSVEALSQLSTRDRSPAVRAAAVTSLGLIGHVSVFVPVLIGMADEAREVRASAARALSRLNLDRADAYVRVIETADQETMARLAGACVTAGLARQAIDRLASEDRRQAYEAFSLLSLVARGGQAGVILEVVEGAGNLKVRQSAARLLALQGQPGVAGRLRAVAADASTPEELRAVISECVARGEYAGARDDAAGGE